MRVVFQFDGHLDRSGRLVHPPRWWIFRGAAVHFRPVVGYNTERVNGGPLRRTEAATACGVFVDGRKVAKGVNDDGGWLVRDRWSCQRLWVDDLPYTVEGRVWEDMGGREEDDTVIPSPCVMCGKKVWHINDPKGRGTAWAGSTRVLVSNAVHSAGDVVQFLYCNREGCNNEHVWTCVFCNVDVVGPACTGCGKARAEADRELPQFAEWR
jgi:hypothetical protein